MCVHGQGMQEGVQGVTDLNGATPVGRERELAGFRLIRRPVLANGITLSLILYIILLVLALFETDNGKWTLPGFLDTPILATLISSQEMRPAAS